MISKNSKRSWMRITLIALLSFILLGVLGQSVIAYFITGGKINKIKIDAATIELAVGELVPESNSNHLNMLPGESFELVAGTNGGIQNTGSRSSIIELDLGRDTTGRLKSTSKAEFGVINRTFPDEYKFVANNVDPLKGIIYFSPQRLAEVIQLGMSTNATEWIEINDKFYIHAKKSEVVGFGKIKFQVMNELGGLTGLTGSKTPERQFEQESTFNMVYGVKAVQATEAAIADEYGDEVYQKIKSKHGVSGITGSWFEF